MNYVGFNKDKHCRHHKLDRVDHDFYLFTWSIPTASWINELDTVQTKKFEMNDYHYRATLNGFRKNFAFSITTTACDVVCSVSLLLGSGTELFSKTLKAATREEKQTRADRSAAYIYHYDLMSLSYDSECYQKVKQHPHDSLIIICRIIFRVEDFSTASVLETAYNATDTLNNMKKLADTLRNFSKSSLKEKVTLRVDEETETVNKAVLCARSKVFADMFKSNTGEVKDNVITITGIKMHVLKVLVSFLYTGKLSKSDVASNGDCNFDFLCDLYRAADKYDIGELRHACVDLLLPQISIENIFQASKFAFESSDERLKSTVKTFIAANVDILVEEKEWKDVMMDKLDIAVQALNFYDV